MAPSSDKCWGSAIESNKTKGFTKCVNIIEMLEYCLIAIR